MEAARAVSELTHFDPDAGDACVLWCCAIRHAVLTGELDVRIGLRHIDIRTPRPVGVRAWTKPRHRRRRLSRQQRLGGRRAAGRLVGDRDHARPGRRSGRRRCSAPITCGWRWRRRCAAATTPTPSRRSPAACSAPPTAHRRCPRAGGLTLHGWPGLSTRGLIQLASKIIDKGRPDTSTTPTAGSRGVRQPVRHPHDDEVWIGGIAALRKLPKECRRVVSLCRVADGHLPAGVKHLDVRLIDQEGENAHLDFVLLDTVRAVEQLRAEGRTVFVHCVQAYSRTPTIAALYGARKRGASTSTRRCATCWRYCRTPTRTPNSVRRCGDCTRTPGVHRDRGLSCTMRPTGYGRTAREPRRRGGRAAGGGHEPVSARLELAEQRAGRGG